MKSRSPKRAALACFLSFVSPGICVAEEDATPNYAEDTLTGDWGGLRSTAEKNGFGWEGVLKVDSLNNSGALHSGPSAISTSG